MTTIEHDGIPVFPDKITVEAYLDGVWTDLTADIVRRAGIKIKSGISGHFDTDLVASPGELRFTLTNHTGKYHPNNPLALAGWKEGVKVRVTITYAGETYTQIVAWVRELRQKTETLPGDDEVTVICYDWIEQAQRANIILPSIVRNKRSDEAAALVLAYAPIQPEGTSFEIGSYVYPTVFDTVKAETTVWSELVKLALSEFEHLYVTRKGILRLENASSRTTETPIPIFPRVCMQNRK